MMRSDAWEPDRGAEAINDHILMSRGIGNSYLVTSESGDVVVTTGTVTQGPRHRQRFEELLGRPLNVRKIVFTQSHSNHIGGWPAFNGPDVETIAQRNFADGRLDWTLLAEFAGRRAGRLFSIVVDEEDRQAQRTQAVEPVLTTTFDDSYSFEIGGRQFELYSVPGGEITDGLAVWLPSERIVFTGNLLGALYGQLPHLYTLRGDRIRSARLFVRSVNRVLDLEPEMLITAHDEPIVGSDRIRADLTRVRDAAQYIHDETVGGMNAGKDLWTLMSEIALPSNLQPLSQGRGRVSWYVRAVWEEYAGWFRFESTTELYPVPQRAVWSEFAELAGGPDVLARHAAAHVKAGRPVEALHFTDIALGVDPRHRTAREVQIAALETLLDRSGDAWDEVRWLETELELAHAALEQ